MADEPTALVPTPANRLPDAYEQKFMAGRGTVLYRDKRRAPWPLHALLGTAMLISVGAVIASGELIGLLIGPPLIAISWLLFSVLRVTVSTGSVNVQYGLFGPEIAMSAIESVEATNYDWKQFGGWGIRRSSAGEWIYNMPGDGGRAVRIVWRDRKDRRVVTLIGSPHHEQLAAQIQSARAALPAAAQRDALPPGE